MNYPAELRRQNYPRYLPPKAQKLISLRKKQIDQLGKSGYQLNAALKISDGLQTCNGVCIMSLKVRYGCLSLDSPNPPSLLFYKLN